MSFSRYTNFISKCSEKASQSFLKNALKANPKEINELLMGSLVEVAILEFPNIASMGDGLNTIVSAINKKQKEKRQETLPILDQLKPNKEIDEALKKWLSNLNLVEMYSKAGKKIGSYKTAIDASSKIDDTKLVIAESYKQLKEAGLINLTADAQQCPICDFEDQPTLILKRIADIESWLPIQNAISTAKDELDEAIRTLISSLTELQKLRLALIPQQINDIVWEESIQKGTKEAKGAAKKFRNKHNKINDDLQKLDSDITSILDTVNKSSIELSEFTKKQKLTSSITSSFSNFIEFASAYAGAYEELDNAVGLITGEDPEYNHRGNWLTLANSISEIEDDIKFDQSKSKALKELKCIREFLMEARQNYLDLRRIDFSESMDELWNKLRADKFSSFSKLHIPEPKGKGFPVNIEVKATIDDSKQQIEVDALKIFSESQINVLGIAAFITRSKMLGHQTIIFDDPVQSMDEDHFKTFAACLLPYLMNEGFHVIILTHNNQFAKDISHYCIDVDGYTTMHIRHSRREGCQVEEGNRRVAERLKKADRKVDEGKFADAWKLIRLAIERLYLVTCIKYGGNQFDPSRFQGQSAEYMWNEGVESIITGKIPTAPPRLKEILDMSAAGVHDKPALGETDIRHAISDLRSYLNTLKVGG